MRRVFVALALMLIASSAFAQETMDETTLRQRVIIAQGKPPDSYREEISITSTVDGDYIRREFHRGIDYKTLYGSGEFSYQSGRFEGREWDCDRNGLTAIHEPPSGNERPEKQTVKLERVNAPFEAWKLSKLNVRGIGSVQYIDAQTYQLRREDQISADEHVETDYSEFKTVEGYTLPTRWVEKDESGKSTVDADVTSFVPAQVSDSDLAVPPSRNLVVFPADKTSVEIPTVFHQFRSTTIHHRSGRITVGFPTGCHT
jgi:hypothetical protein